MISSENLRFLKKFVDIAYLLKCCPFRLVLANGKVARIKMASSKSLILRKSVISTVIFLQVFIIHFGLFYHKYYNPAPNETAHFFYIAAFMSTAISIETVGVVFVKEASELINTFLIFSEKLSTVNLLRYLSRVCILQCAFLDRFHKTKPDHKDGAEMYLKLLIFNAVGVSALAIPASYLLVVEEVHFGKLINIHPTAALAYGLLMGSIVFVDWISVMYFYNIGSNIYNGYTKKPLSHEVRFNYLSR